MQLNKTDLLNVERELCRRSLADFAKAAWHVLEPSTPLKWGWALDAICIHLEAVTRGDIRRLLINVPPGTMKSLLVGVIWPAWEWGPRGLPGMRYVGTAHEEGLAVRDSRQMRNLVKSDWYQERWPLEIPRDQDGKQEFGNSATGFRIARAFTGMTGRRGDRVILDDPISADNANSDAKLKAAEIAFTETLPTRVNDPFESAIVVIMQRLNEKDVSGIILERELDYVHLRIPMRFEPDERCVTSIGWSDPRTTEGELMFPERFSEKDVQELEKTLGSYGTAGQLQQRPSPRGGGMIKLAWFGRYTTVPPLDFRFVTVDTAQKIGQGNDYSVLECWGRSVSGQAVILDVARDKWEAPELLKNSRNFWIKHRDSGRPESLTVMIVEDKVSGTGLIQTLRREGIPVLAIQRDKDKVARGFDAAPFIESGNVLLPEYAHWLEEFEAEVGKFPGGAHDDQCDPMFDAIEHVQKAPARQQQKQVEALPTVNHWR